jgi:hypothetical protein
MTTMRKCNDEIYQLAKDQALVKMLKNKRCKPFCLCPPDVMLIYIIDHNPSWKEIQRQKKREFLDPRVTNITSGGHKQKGLHLLFFNILTRLNGLTLSPTYCNPQT